MTDENPLQSVTHEKDLDEFLSSAALADTDFTAGMSLTLMALDVADDDEQSATTPRSSQHLHCRLRV
jgi:hypothetical protein